jgi:hypothetical protein
MQVEHRDQNMAEQTSTGVILLYGPDSVFRVDRIPLFQITEFSDNFDPRLSAHVTEFCQTQQILSNALTGNLLSTGKIITEFCQTITTNSVKCL